jgi:hypothetical protein
MKTETIRGKTIQWTFTDGPLANRTFEHSFHEDGTLEVRMVDGDGIATGRVTAVAKYEVATVGANVLAASYLGPSGFALTVVFDFQGGKLVAFASNEKELSVQHGTFKVVGAARAGAGSQAAQHPPSLR